MHLFQLFVYCNFFKLSPGIAVYAYDHVGHGRSEPKEEKDRCFFRDFADVVSALS
jgi:alpha-beta hydrolase superfamily lysophospholipase